MQYFGFLPYDMRRSVCDLRARFMFPGEAKAEA
jgi:hypothetical protein